MNFLIRYNWSTSKQRLANKRVTKYITYYVLNIIPVKSTTPNELEKLCILNSTILEIECLFHMKKNDYRSLITLLFESDKFINDTLETLASNHPISTQECMLSVNCEKNIFESFKKNIFSSKIKIKRMYFVTRMW